MEAGWREFDTSVNIWDAFAGHSQFPLELTVGMDLRDLQGLSTDLVQSRWRPSTRALYQGWVVLWNALCRSACVPALPCNSQLLCTFVTVLAVSRAGGTVAIACSALIAYSALNDLANPFSASPLANSAFKAAVKVRQGPRKPAKDGVDPAFVVRLWEHFLPRREKISFEEKRMWSLIQLGWEAANRPGELTYLKLCGIMRVALVLAEASADKLERVLRAKNDAKLRGQLTRLVSGGESAVPNFCWLFDNVYEPALRELGFVRHARCPSLLRPANERLRTEPCTYCPPLFPTRPTVKAKKSSKTVVIDGVVRAVSTQKITDDVRAAATLIGFEHLSLSGKSLRIGGFSAATEDGNEEAVGLAAAELRWASTRVPLSVYKRRTVNEQRATGRALQSAMARALSAPPASSSLSPSAALTVQPHPPPARLSRPPPRTCSLARRRPRHTRQQRPRLARSHRPCRQSGRPLARSAVSLCLWQPWRASMCAAAFSLECARTEQRVRTCTSAILVAWPMECAPSRKLALMPGRRPTAFSCNPGSALRQSGRPGLGRCVTGAGTGSKGEARGGDQAGLAERQVGRA